MSRTSSITIWDRLHERFVKLSPIKHYDEVDFIISLIISGAKERDGVYFGSDTFLYHCSLARLNPEFILEVVNGINYHIDNKIPFNIPKEDTLTEGLFEHD